MPDAFEGAKLNLFADDTAITVQSSCPIELECQLQAQVNRAAIWLT